jgi:class 3 adenylate cyclase
VRCAVELQRDLALRNDRVPRERRIGINLGDIIIDEHDIYGDGVNVAARLERLAEPGGVYVSRVVRDQVRDKLNLAFEDLVRRGIIHRRFQRCSWKGTARPACRRSEAQPCSGPVLPERGLL